MTKLCFFFAYSAIFMLCSGAVNAQNDSVKKSNLLIFPVLAKSIETGWSGGVAGAFTFRLSKKDTVSRTSNLQALGLYSLKKQLVVALNGAQYAHGERYILNEQVSFSSFPDQFWGLGKYTPDSAKEPYSFKQFYTYFHLMRKLGRRIFVGALFEYQLVDQVKYVAGGAFDKQQVVGRDGYHIAGLGLSFTYDSRNHAFSPDKGGFAQVYFNHFGSYLGSEHRYTNIVLDLRRYISLGNDRVLALQAFSFNNTGNDAPLRSLASLGGANSMRGYYAGRFRDNSLAVLQAEFRFPVYKRFGAVAFGSAGDVGHDYKDYALKDLKYSFGAGLRFALNKSEKLNLRLDYGIGQGNNSGLYFQLGEAF